MATRKQRDAETRAMRDWVYDTMLEDWFESDPKMRKRAGAVRRIAGRLQQDAAFECEVPHLPGKYRVTFERID